MGPDRGGSLALWPDSGRLLGAARLGLEKRAAQGEFLVAPAYPRAWRLHRADDHCVRRHHADRVGGAGGRQPGRPAVDRVHRRLLVHAVGDTTRLLRCPALADDVVATLWLP